MAYNNDKKKIALQLDLPIIKELVLLMNKAGWELDPDPFYLLWKLEERRLMYSRRSGFLQIYWNGFGHQTIQTSLSDWAEAKDIVKWTTRLEDMELIQIYHEDEEEFDFEESDSLSIINSIFL